MRQEPNIAVDFAGIRLANPVFTASGTCGYADELVDLTDVQGLGGFITKSITSLPRKGNPTPRIVETDAGMLNAIGLANVGLDRFIDEKLPLLRQMTIPVFVNVAGTTIEEYVKVVERLADERAITGFELNISCPNVKKGGISFGTDPRQVTEITAAIRQAAARKVLVVKLSPTVTDIGVTARAAAEAGADALSLVNTFTAMVVDVETRRPVLANRTGGLSGPAIRPMAVYLVHKVYSEVAKAGGIPDTGPGRYPNRGRRPGVHHRRGYGGGRGHGDLRESRVPCQDRQLESRTTAADTGRGDIRESIGSLE